MFSHYHDYYWKDGKPYGKDKTEPALSSHSYKIVSDPYFKRISIEKYHFTQFDKIIYDSYMLDFRHLTLKDQMAWRREVLNESEHETVCILHNEDDRAVLFETLTFEGDLCRCCRTSSIHAIPLSQHQMYYSHLNDPFNGLILFDIEHRPVMLKTYEFDLVSNEFTNLELEEWNMQNPSPIILQCLK